MLRATLDSWALMALLDDEPAAARVAAVIDEGTAVMSWINLGEVYYQTVRRRGEPQARLAIEAIQRRVRVETPDAAIVMAAAEIKAGGGLSYADAFCVATARRHRTAVYTGDPEIVRMDAPGIEVIDLRSTV